MLSRDIITPLPSLHRPSSAFFSYCLYFLVPYKVADHEVLGSDHRVVVFCSVRYVFHMSVASRLLLTSRFSNTIPSRGGSCRTSTTSIRRERPSWLHTTDRELSISHPDHSKRRESVPQRDGMAGGAQEQHHPTDARLAWSYEHYGPGHKLVYRYPSEQCQRVAQHWHCCFRRRIPSYA